MGQACMWHVLEENLFCWVTWSTGSHHPWHGVVLHVQVQSGSGSFLDPNGLPLRGSTVGTVSFSVIWKPEHENACFVGLDGLQYQKMIFPRYDSKPMTYHPASSTWVVPSRLFGKGFERDFLGNSSRENLLKTVLWERRWFWDPKWTKPLWPLVGLSRQYRIESFVFAIRT